MKKIFFFLLGLNLVFGISIAFAQESQQKSDTTIHAAKAVDVGNKICPVSEEKIDEKTKATYEYNGKIYNFCCPMCIDAFKNDPEKYIKKVEEELQQPKELEKEQKDSKEMPMGMHEGHSH